MFYAKFVLHSLKYKLLHHWICPIQGASGDCLAGSPHAKLSEHSNFLIHSLLLPLLLALKETLAHRNYYIKNETNLSEQKTWTQFF